MTKEISYSIYKKSNTCFSSYDTIIINKPIISFFERVFESIITYDKNELFEWYFFKMFIPNQNWIVYYSIELNRLDILKILHRFSFPLFKKDEFRYFIYGMIKKHNNEMAIWLYTQFQQSLDYFYFNEATKNGNLEFCKWFYNKYKHVFDVNLVCFYPAAESGNLLLCKWLVSLGSNIHEFNDYGIFCAAFNRKLHICKWLLELAPQINVEQLIIRACYIKNYECFKLLYHLNNNTCAKVNKIDSLKHVVESYTKMYFDEKKSLIELLMCVELLFTNDILFEINIFTKIVRDYLLFDKQI